MKLELLADNLDAHKVVARWYFDEWLGATPGATIERLEARLAKATNRDSAPLMVLARLDGKARQ